MPHFQEQIPQNKNQSSISEAYTHTMVKSTFDNEDHRNRVFLDTKHECISVSRAQHCSFIGKENIVKRVAAQSSVFLHFHIPSPHPSLFWRGCWVGYEFCLYFSVIYLLFHQHIFTNTQIAGIVTKKYFWPCWCRASLWLTFRLTKNSSEVFFAHRHSWYIFSQ